MQDGYHASALSPQANAHTSVLSKLPELVRRTTSIGVRLRPALPRWLASLWLEYSLSRALKRARRRRLIFRPVPYVLAGLALIAGWQKLTMVHFSPLPGILVLQPRAATDRRAANETSPADPSPRTAVVTSTHKGKKTWVGKFKVNLRQGPGWKYPVLGELPEGTRVKVLNKTATGWVEVETQVDPSSTQENGVHGFINGDLLDTE
ncbi:MAG TPA: SH3 domain-containing protein [Xanthobacteraceae bacterium]|jgi:hypothetical protein